MNAISLEPTLSERTDCTRFCTGFQPKCYISPERGNYTVSTKTCSIQGLSRLQNSLYFCVNSSTQEQLNKGSGTRLKKESETAERR